MTVFLFSSNIPNPPVRRFSAPTSRGCVFATRSSRCRASSRRLVGRILALNSYRHLLGIVGDPAHAHWDALSASAASPLGCTRRSSKMVLPSFKTLFTWEVPFDFGYQTLVRRITRLKQTVLYETASYRGFLNRTTCAGVCPTHCFNDLVRCG